MRCLSARISHNFFLHAPQVGSKLGRKMKSLLAASGHVLVLLVAAFPWQGLAYMISAVMELDGNNFYLTIANYQFVVVEFYDPNCSYCTALAPEWEAAAVELKKNVPPIILAKVNALYPQNVGLVLRHGNGGRSFPWFKIFSRWGEIEEEYDWRDAASTSEIITFLRNQLQPPSVTV